MGEEFETFSGSGLFEELLKRANRFGSVTITAELMSEIKQEIVMSNEFEKFKKAVKVIVNVPKPTKRKPKNKPKKKPKKKGG